MKGAVGLVLLVACLPLMIPTLMAELAIDLVVYVWWRARCWTAARDGRPIPAEPMRLVLR